jgi:hypothetical protein
MTTTFTYSTTERMLEAVFSTRSVLRCYKQDSLSLSEELVVETVRKKLRSSCYELLLLKTGTWCQGPFGNPEKGEQTPLKAATKQRLEKTIRLKSNRMYYSDLWSLLTSCIRVHYIRLHILYAWQCHNILVFCLPLYSHSQEIQAKYVLQALET